MVAMLCHTLTMSLLLGLPAGVPIQDDKQQAEAPVRVSTPIGLVRVATDDEAKELSAKVKKYLTPAVKRGKRLARSKRDPKPEPDGDLLTRLEIVEQLGQVQHKDFVRPLLDVLQFDPSDAVRTKAAVSFQAQPEKQVVPSALKLLDDKDVLEKGTLAEPMIRVLSFYGAKDSAWQKLYKRFEEMGANAQVALLESIGQRKDFDALDLLLDNLDPPQPANVDDPNNPPADYWKARWQAWQAFKPALRTAVRNLLGQDFESAKAAKEWIEKQGGVRALRKKAEG